MSCGMRPMVQGGHRHAGNDTSNDIHPNRYENIVPPPHIACLVYLGVWRIDNANLGDIAEVAARHGRYEFMLSIGTLRLRNATGSPVNPSRYSKRIHNGRVSRGRWPFPSTYSINGADSGLSKPLSIPASIAFWRCRSSWYKVWGLLGRQKEDARCH